MKVWEIFVQIYAFCWLITLVGRGFRVKSVPGYYYCSNPPQPCQPKWLVVSGWDWTTSGLCNIYYSHPVNNDTYTSLHVFLETETNMLNPVSFSIHCMFRDRETERGRSQTMLVILPFFSLFPISVIFLSLIGHQVENRACRFLKRPLTPDWIQEERGLLACSSKLDGFFQLDVQTPSLFGSRHNSLLV